MKSILTSQLANRLHIRVGKFNYIRHMLLSYQERIKRVLNTTHVISIENFKMFRVKSVQHVDDIIFVNVGDIHFQDTEVMTLHEVNLAENALESIKKTLQLT